MNIETFLKRIPIHLHSNAQRNQAVAQRPLIMLADASNHRPNDRPSDKPYRTTNSIGTFGSSEVQEEQSMIESRFQSGSALPPFNTFENVTSAASRLNTLEDELNNIEKLKQMYESKAGCQPSIRSRGAQRSVQKSSEGRSQSNQKHNLRPSNTPSFVKKYSENSSGSPTSDFRRRQSQNRLRHFYEQANQKSQKKDAYTCTSQEEESPTRKSRRQPSDSQRNHELLQYTNRLEDQLKDKVAELEYKSTKLTQMQLQNHDYKEKLKEVMRQNLQLRQDSEKIKEEKEQLESLLKELLYEREREKLARQKATSTSVTQQQTANKTNRSSHAYKENRQPLSPMPLSPTPNREVKRQMHRKQEDESMHYEQNKSARLFSNTLRSNQQGGNRANKSQLSDTQDEREQKKVKVQNILDKLKIKINRY